MLSGHQRVASMAGRVPAGGARPDMLVPSGAIDATAPGRRLSTSARVRSWLERDVRRPAAGVGVGMLLFRWLVVGCLAATIALTWPLWQVHQVPPMLPAVALPAVDLGVPLLASLALVVVTARVGIVLHTLLLAYAIAIDQYRLQPEVVSLAILLWGTLPSHTLRTLARAHLVSLWLFAGINKLLSPGFMHGTAQWMLAGLVPDAPAWLDDHAGWVIAGAELGTGLLALLPATRLLAGFAGFALHAGILLDLSPLGHDWNTAVWPWNVALAFAGFALIVPWRGAPWLSLRECHPLARPLPVLLMVAPLGFYVGVVDAYLAHNLYSSNVPRANVVCAAGCRPGQQPAEAWRVFNVPMPPEPRLYEQLFMRTCRPGDRLVINDPRWWFRARGEGQRRIGCPPGLEARVDARLSSATHGRPPRS